jgi:hypothetical protein
MIEEGDLLGFLHLFDAEVFIEFQSRGIVAPSYVQALRPALMLVEQSPHSLEGALTIEKMFWQKWDHVRLKSYLNSSKPYYAALLTEKNEIAALNLMEQHNALVWHASSLLPISPYLETPVARWDNPPCRRSLT